MAKTKAKTMAKPLPRGVYEKVAGSGIYWIHFSDFDRKRHREVAGSLANAKRLLSVRRADKLKGKIPELRRPAAAPVAPIITVGELIDTAIVSTASHLSKRDLHAKFERIRINLGVRTATEVVKSDLVQWLDEAVEEYEWSNASRNRYQAALSLLFRIAVEDKKLTTNPAAGIAHLQEDNSRTRHLSLDEEKALLKALNKNFPTYTPIVTLAMHTGPRRSELFRGLVGDYDPETGKLAIRQTKIRESPTLRYVPLTPLALDAYNTLAKGKPVGTPLCSRLDGESPLTQTQYWFDPCVKEAKLVDFHFHDLRHTAASRWVMNGVPIAVVSGYLGHRNIQMTMRYAHMSPDNDERAVAAMMSIYKDKTATATATGTIEGKTVH